MGVRSVLGLLLVLLTASACNLPSGGGPGTTEVPEVEAIYTAAVQTVIANLTQSAPTPGGVKPTSPAGPTQAGAGETLSPEPPAASPSPEPEASATLGATLPQPTATSAALDSDPRAALGDPDWQDSFEDDKNWSLSEDENSAMEVDDGKLVMTAYKANQSDWWALTWPELEDFYLETTGRFGECAERDRFGVIVRAPNDATRGYLFALACDGRYAFWIIDTEDMKRTVLIDWTASPHIAAGAGSANRLGLKAEGDRFSLYANGNLLEEISDGTLAGPHFGVFAGAARTEGFRVELDELAYWELP